jgi:hypothetical protein
LICSSASSTRSRSNAGPIGLSCQLSTKLNLHQGLRELVRANPDRLKISLSGYTAERYARTHARGNVRLVKAKMHLLRNWLDESGATTRVWVGPASGTTVNCASTRP